MKTSLIVAVFWILCAVSWATNIYKFATCDFESPYKTEILRGVGIPFAPIGIIIGFMDIGEENK